MKKQASQILKSQIIDDLILVGPTKKQIAKSRLKKLQNFRSTQKVADSDEELLVINNDNESIHASDIKSDLQKLRQLHCDSALKVYRNIENIPLTKNTGELVEKLVEKSVQMFDKTQIIGLASDVSKQTLLRMKNRVSVEH